MATGPEQISRVGVVGLGYWGPKLARCFHQLGALKWVCDLGPGRVQEVCKWNPSIQGTTDYESMLDHVDALAIATPPETHYEIAKRALLVGKHVFVEKPLATSHAEARALEELAEKERLRLMVGHIYLHCPGLMAIPCDPGSKEVFISFLNPQGAPSNTSRDIKWAALPHAASIALHFITASPEAIEGRSYEHGLMASLAYWDDSRVCVQVGDFTGIRRRQVEVRIGNTRHLYDGGLPNRHDVCSGVWTQQAMHEDREPLLLECETFLKGTVGPFSEVPGSAVVSLVWQIWQAVKQG